jgi:hypothetical protein
MAAVKREVPARRPAPRPVQRGGALTDDGAVVWAFVVLGLVALVIMGFAGFWA